MSLLDDIMNQQIIPNMNHSNAEVRKNVVFCLVEIRFIIGPDDFKQIFTKLPIS